MTNGLFKFKYIYYKIITKERLAQGSKFVDLRLFYLILFYDIQLMSCI